VHNGAVCDASSDEILIAGLGSVGRRHLTNLQALGWKRIRLYRTGYSTLTDADLSAFPAERDLDEALARKPLAVLVCNPSALHVPVALAAARAGAHLFIEKPLSHRLDGLWALEEAVDERQLTALVGFQFRFNPGLRQLKAWIECGAIGKVLSVQVHWGEHLPTMHPWEDYRLGYAARRELGGGALLTFCHVFDYLRWLIGDVETVQAAESSLVPLPIDVETCVDVTLHFNSGTLGHVHLDFIQQPHTHQLTVIGTTGTLTWSHEDHMARWYSSANQAWQTAPPPEGFERNWMFLDEMRHFVACLRGAEAPLCTLRDGRETVRIVEAAKQALDGRPVLSVIRRGGTTTV
jgi:predicted dehydrogenase